MAPVKEVITRTSVALDATMAEVRDVAVQDPDPGDEVETETVNQGGQGPVTVRRGIFHSLSINALSKK